MQREEREQGCAFRSHSMGAVRSVPSKPLNHNSIYQALFVLGGGLQIEREEVQILQ